MNVRRITFPSFALKHNAPSSASAANAMSCLRMVSNVGIAPFKYMGLPFSVSFHKKNGLQFDFVLVKDN